MRYKSCKRTLEFFATGVLRLDGELFLGYDHPEAIS